jgi:uncharacterized protein with von Willebrand factor type A (vWA) domain
MSKIDDALSALQQLVGEKPDDVEPATDAAEGARQAPVSDTAMQVDRWGRRIAQQLATEFDDSDGDCEDQDYVDEVADGHFACYEANPQLAQSCRHPIRHKWYGELMQSPDFQRMRQTTAGDDYMSELGAQRLVNAFRRHEESLTDEEREGEEAQTDDESHEDGPQGDPGPGTVKRVMSVHKAVQEAQGELQVAADAGTAFGEGGSVDSHGMLAAYRAVRNDPRLRQISEQAGRFIRTAKGLQARKVCRGMQGVVGVTLGRKAQHLVVSELVKFGTDLELDLLRRLTQGQAVCRDFRSVEPDGRGPVMVMVDESSSMEGDRIAAAKGFALSLAWLAQHQKRWCCLVGWSSAGQVRELVIEPGKSSGELMNWCSSMFGGGTDPPLGTVPELFEQTGAPEGKTDVVWITDGECGPSGIDEFNSWRADHQVKVWTVGIGCDATSFHDFSDKVTSVTQLSADEPVVSELLSL